MSEYKKDRASYKEGCVRWLEALVQSGTPPSAIAEMMSCRDTAISKMLNRKDSRVPWLWELYNYSTSSGTPLDMILAVIFHSGSVDPSGTERDGHVINSKNLEEFSGLTEPEQRFLLEVAKLRRKTENPKKTD